MKDNSTEKLRKKIRLSQYDYSSPGAYFITICTKNRLNYFWEGELDTNSFSWKYNGINNARPINLPLSPIGETVLEELERWGKTYDGVSLYSYVIMPNHLHIVAVILADERGRPQQSPSVSRMVQQFKGAVTKKTGKSIWQKSFMEHVIRDKKDYEMILKYICENPLRWQQDQLYSEE